MDADEFKKRFMPFYAKLYRIAVALVGNQNDAEDLLQDAYAKLWQKRNELTGVHNYEAFCVTLMKNVCLDFLRSPSVRHQGSDVSEAYWLQSDVSPGKRVEEQEQVRNVREWIRQLPEKQRQVLRLQSFGDCSMDEIAEITGCSTSNVRVLLFRARKTIRERFKKLYKNE